MINPKYKIQKNRTANEALSIALSKAEYPRLRHIEIENNVNDASIILYL